MKRVDTLEIIDRAQQGLEVGRAHTGGLLEVISNTPNWALEPGDARPVNTEHQEIQDHLVHELTDTHRHDHDNDHGHDPSRADTVGVIEPVSAIELLTENKPEIKDGFEYEPVVVKVADLLTTPGLLGRVLLLPVDKKGFIPITIMPDAEVAGRVKIIKFNEPYNPAEKGIDEGKILALSLELMTKTQAGFGGHGLNGINPFEGGHLSVATLASKDLTTENTLRERGHTGTHQVINGSVVTKLDQVGLTPRALVPRIQTIDTLGVNPGALMQVYWRKDMVDVNGVPLRANHPEASAIVIGDMIIRLGSEGLDNVSKFVEMASKD